MDIRGEYRVCRVFARGSTRAEVRDKVRGEYRV